MRRNFFVSLSTAETVEAMQCIVVDSKTPIAQTRTGEEIANNDKNVFMALAPVMK
jgi:hypothetical protein